MKKRLLLLLSVGILTYSCAIAQVVINEYSAANFSDIADNYGEYEDWIELLINLFDLGALLLWWRDQHEALFDDAGFNEPARVPVVHPNFRCFCLGWSK